MASTNSPTIASAIGNLLSIFTFILAIIFQDGKAGLIKDMKQSSQSVGTTVSVSGAFVAALCNGSAIFSPSNDTEIATECKGPLFVAVSRVLGHWEFAIAAVMVVSSLRDALHLGRLRQRQTLMMSRNGRSFDNLSS